VSITELFDGSKLDECNLHEPCVWGRGWTVLAICLRKNSAYFCPCINWLNVIRQLLHNILEHLLCGGIKKNYTTWIWHSKLPNMQRGSWTIMFSASTCPYVWYIGKWFEESFVSWVQEVIDTIVRGVKSG